MRALAVRYHVVAEHPSPQPSPAPQAADGGAGDDRRSVGAQTIAGPPPPAVTALNIASLQGALAALQTALEVPSSPEAAPAVAAPGGDPALIDRAILLAALERRAVAAEADAAAAQQALERAQRSALAERLAAQARIKQHLSYRWGAVLLSVGRNPVRALGLPWYLFREWLAFHDRRHPDGIAGPGCGGRRRARRGAERAARRLVATALPRSLASILRVRAGSCWVAVLRADGIDAVLARLDRAIRGANPAIRVRALLIVASWFRAAGEHEASYRLTEAALAHERSEAVLRAVYWSAQRALRLQEACDAAIALEEMFGPLPTAEQTRLLEKIKRSSASQLAVLRAIGPRQPPRVESVGRRVCYVVHNSLPYSSGGYATRSHGVALGLREAGYEVIVLSRPGFPLDISAELTADGVAASDSIDGIAYVRTLEPLRRHLDFTQYVTAAADAIEARLREFRPEVVIAASNHVTALPALIAARRLGLPFLYEVRGFWEITRLSREEGFDRSHRFVAARLLEAAVAGHADHVFTLTEPMREELISRGVDRRRIELLPNSCDPERFVPRGRDADLAAGLGIPDGVPVIGYIGTFVDYEGLEDLAAAAAVLKRRGHVFRLLLVGNENASGSERGAITERILATAARAGFTDWLLLPGRVPHEDVERYYSLIDIAPFPRKPWPVCEMVSPMKPLEALAMEKAVVVSSVRALTEMIDHGRNGLVFAKGSVDALADALASLIADPARRAALGSAGRAWVCAERTWTGMGRRMAAVLAALPQGASVGA